MEAKPKFEILYTEEAMNLLNSISIEDKVKDKMIYNIEKSRYVIDKGIFKKVNIKKRVGLIRLIPLLRLTNNYYLSI